MKKLVLGVSTLLILAILTPCKAQYYYYDNDYYDTPLLFEIGGSIGGMNCLTDVGGRKGIGKKFVKDITIKNTNLCGSVYASVTYQNAVTLRLEGTFGQIKAYDSILKSVKESTFGRYERNLSFRSNISEIALTAEIHPLHLFINWAEREQDPPRFSPYITGGIGYFSFNPQAKLGNKWIDLQPLSTEGQGFKEFPNRKPYSLKQVCFPLGLGVRYELSPMFNARFEIMYRILTTDYLDDVSTFFINPTLFSNYFTGSKLTNALLLNDRHQELNPGYITYPDHQRGDPKDNDAYFSANLKIGLILGRQRVRRH